ncbi:MAG: hypothetical protein LBV61_02225 [Burkholderiaceae bacterium]|jgi:hypothetical protein|nr:hypothetical protein [Burkholderiaceae bacterium]
MLEHSALPSIHPLILTPAYGGSVTSSYANSVLALSKLAMRVGMPLDFGISGGSSLVTRARNEMLVDFLVHPQFTHVVWIDADISFDPQDLLRMLLLDLDVVAAAYPVKNYRWPIDVAPGAREVTRAEFMRQALRYPVNSHEAAALPLTPDANGLLEVTEAPTGFMAIKRGVFDLMRARFPHLRYVPDGLWPPERRAQCYRFFDTMVEESTQRYLSEDYAFCNRWRSIGGRVFIDTRVSLGHTGTHEFRGSLADALAQPRRFPAMGGGRIDPAVFAEKTNSSGDGKAEG